MTPDSRCFAKIGSARDAYATLLRCLEYGEGVGIVSGATGSGKSSLCLAIESELGHHFETAFLTGENFSSYTHFLKTIFSELDEPVSCHENFELQTRLKKYAEKSQRHRSGIVLFLDEAQSLQKEICAGLRVISNWNAQGKPLFRMMLSGNWHFEEMLMSPEFEFLNERVGAHVILESLSRQETSEYIDYRIRHCGARTYEIFTTESLDAIGQISEGVPRVVNLLCDRCLQIAFEKREKPLSAETVGEAAEKLKHLPVALSEFSIRNPLEESDSMTSIEIETETTGLDLDDSDDCDDSDSFVFEVGDSDTANSLTEPVERCAEEFRSNDCEEAGVIEDVGVIEKAGVIEDVGVIDEAGVIEVGAPKDSHPQREWKSMNEILIDSKRKDFEEPTQRHDDEGSSIEIGEISGDCQETGDDSNSVLSETDSLTELVVEVENHESDIAPVKSWKKIPVDLHWNDSTTSTLSSVETERPAQEERKKIEQFVSAVEVSSSQNFARIRPEQLLQTLVSETFNANRELIESDSSWLRHNDTKIYDCVASEPVSYRDDTYQRMKVDYEHSLDLVDQASSVANTGYESDVVDSLLLLLSEIEEACSRDSVTPGVSKRRSSKKSSATYALSELNSRFGESPDEEYDIVFPETVQEKEQTENLARYQSDIAKEFEIPKQEQSGDYRHLLSDLFRRESRQ